MKKKREIKKRDGIDITTGLYVLGFLCGILMFPGPEL